MQKIDGSKFRLLVAHQESIKVEILNASGIADQMNIVFNDAAEVRDIANPFTHRFEKHGQPPRPPDPNPSDLTVRVTFTGQGGGRLTIRVSSESGGDVSSYDYAQSGSQATQPFNYTFQIA
jgi:hypothetical protein